MCVNALKRFGDGSTTVGYISSRGSVSLGVGSLLVFRHRATSRPFALIARWEHDGMVNLFIREAEADSSRVQLPACTGRSTHLNAK